MSAKSRVYFDIETYNPQPPFFSGKVITIAYKESGSETRVLKEWESDESSILRAFVKRVREDPGNTELVGFNILRFDIPSIINRVTRIGLDDPEELLDTLHNTIAIDLMHCLLPSNGFSFRGLSALNVSQKLQIPCPRERGSEVLRFYENKQYDRIEEHVREDIVFTESLDKELRKRMNQGATLSF